MSVRVVLIDELSQIKKVDIYYLSGGRLLPALPRDSASYYLRRSTEQDTRGRSAD